MPNLPAPAKVPSPPGSPIPLPVKLAYTAFMAVLVPVYWASYGPTNFLYFCDVALLLALIGIWTESALLVSMCAVGILLPQALWVADFVGTALGRPLTGMTAYMFDPTKPLFLRGLSGFHGWLPFLLVALVWRLGYDRRALPAWSGLAVALLLVCFLFMPPPNPDPGLTPVNINYVWGLSDLEAQTWVPAPAWLLGLVVGLPLLLFLPTHLVLARVMPAAAPVPASAPDRLAEVHPA